MSEAVKAAMHCDYVMDELDIPRAGVIQIGVDASAAISFADNTASAGRMKHIDVRCDWMMMLRDRSKIIFVKVPGDINPSDFMTKIFPGVEFARKNEELVHKVVHIRK